MKILNEFYKTEKIEKNYIDEIFYILENQKFNCDYLKLILVKKIISSFNFLMEK